MKTNYRTGSEATRETLVNCHLRLLNYYFSLSEDLIPANQRKFLIDISKMIIDRCFPGRFAPGSVSLSLAGFNYRIHYQQRE